MDLVESLERIPGQSNDSFSSATGFIPFHADLGGLWGEVNVGVSAQARTNATLYANASYQSRFDGGGFADTGRPGFGSIGRSCTSRLGAFEACQRNAQSVAPKLEA